MKKIDFIQHQGVNKKDIERVGRSLFCFSKDNCLRRVCFKIVNHRWYDAGVLVLIFVSTIMLTLDNPNDDEHG